MVDLSKQIKELQKKGVMYDNLKTRYIDFAKKAKKLGDELIALSKEIDPVRTISTKKSSNNYKEKIEELYSKLKAGTHVTSKLVNATYPELSDSGVFQVMTKLANLSNVEKIRDKRAIRLYIQKEG